MSKHADQRTVPSVARAVEALETLARSGRPMTLGEIANSLRAPKSTMLNIIRTLVARRMLLFEPATKTYRLGYLIGELAVNAREGLQLSGIAKPYLDRLATATQEAVFLSVLDGDEIIFIEKVECPQPIRHIAAEVGTRRPLYCTSPGKVSLAVQAPSAIDAYLAKIKLQRYTENTITDLRKLREELAEIRERGYAIADGELMPDLMGVAVPVFRRKSDELVAVVSVAGPAFRMRRRSRQIARAAKHAAEAISIDLGPFASPQPL